MTTPKMSTYLLAFCVGEFEFVSAQTKSGVLARIFACPGQALLQISALKPLEITHLLKIDLKSED